MLPISSHANDQSPESYQHSLFVDFYDTMVSECYGGTAARDVQHYAALLQSFIDHNTSSGHERVFVVVDLACGSGRATLAILEHFTSSPLPRLPPGVQLHIYCIDNSQPMLSAAQAQCNAFLQQHSCPGISIKYLLASFQDWRLPDAVASADFILVAAAGLHHVTDTQQLQHSVRLMSQHLSDSGWCIISYLPWAQLYRDPDATPAGQSAESFRVTGYKRTLLSRWVETIPAGASRGAGSDTSSAAAADNEAKVVHERFSLVKLADSSSGTGLEQEEWRIEEGWQLRQIEREHLLQLAGDAQLVPVTSAAPLGGATLPAELQEEHGSASHFIVFEKRR